ncbi:MAG: coproporphyrinogen III oxidase, partial [Acidiferrobacteraceae bacterium]
MVESPGDFARVTAYLEALQDRICAAIETEDGATRFREDLWPRPEGGGGRTRVLQDGAVFEQAGVNYSSVSGGTLPVSASAGRPQLAGMPFRAQ